MFFSLTLLTAAFFGGVAIGDNTEIIHNTDEFIEFANAIRLETKDYSDTTVLLDSDIDLTGKQLLPINYTSKVFDGQGHKISNLVIQSSERIVGLFMYSFSGIVKNLVLDDTCSITSSSTISNYVNVNVGGITGYSHGDF